MHRAHALLAGLALSILPSLTASTAFAEDAAKGSVGALAGLSLELNSLQPSDKGCRLTFVITNRLEGDVSRAAFEIALFDRTGMVDRMSVLDFRDLRRGKTKVSRFDLPGADCGKISRVLVNGATECTGSGVKAPDCIDELRTSTRTEIEFGS